MPLMEMQEHLPTPNDETLPAFRPVPCARNLYKPPTPSVYEGGCAGLGTRIVIVVFTQSLLYAGQTAPIVRWASRYASLSCACICTYAHSMRSESLKRKE